MSALRRNPKQPMLLRNPQGVWKGTSVTLLAKKGLRQNNFFDRFLRGNANTSGCQKWASKALHSRILNPKFTHPKGSLLRTQICVKMPLRCNGLFVAICVSRHKVDAHHFSNTLQTQTYILLNLAFGFYIGTV